jgi:uracil-DNA glycosylase
MEWYAVRARELVDAMASWPSLADHIDRTAPTPSPFGRNPTPRLVILGQDPTVQNVKSRSKISTVLNLDQPRWTLYRYLESLCSAIGIGLSEVYATNAVNCFFTAPPAYTKRGAVLQEAFGHWLPLLLEELRRLPGVPVVTLGEPVFGLLHQSATPIRIRDYWGYPNGTPESMRHSLPEENLLGRPVFPFPHIRSASKSFYKGAWAGYTRYTRTALDPARG